MTSLFLDLSIFVFMRCILLHVFFTLFIKFLITTSISGKRIMFMWNRSLDIPHNGKCLVMTQPWSLHYWSSTGNMKQVCTAYLLKLKVRDHFLHLINLAKFTLYMILEPARYLTFIVIYSEVVIRWITSSLFKCFMSLLQAKFLRKSYLFCRNNKLMKGKKISFGGQIVIIVLFFQLMWLSSSVLKIYFFSFHSKSANPYVVKLSILDDELALTVSGFF